MGKVIKDSILNTIITYSGIVIGYLNKGLLFPLLLLPEEVGLVNIIVLLSIYFARFSNLGSGTIVIRFAPLLSSFNKGALKLFHFTFSLALIGLIGVSLIYLIFNEKFLSLYIEQSPLLVDYAYWIFPLGVATAMYYYFEPFLRARDKNLISVFLQDFVLRLLVLISLILYSFSVIKIETFIILFFSSHFIPGLFLFVYSLGREDINFSFEKKGLKKKLKKAMLSYGLFVYINNFGQIIILMADTVMIAAISGLKEVGVFTTMVFIANVLTVPYISILRISTPLIPKYWKEKNFEMIKNLHRNISVIGYTLTFFMFSVIWFNFDWIISFLPSEYAEGKYVFLFLMIARIIDSLGSINGDILLNSKSYRIELLITFPLIILTFFLNYIFIPEYGGVGAAMATSVVFLVFNLIRLIINFNLFGIHPFTKKVLLVMGISFVMLFIGSIFPHLSIGVLDFILQSMISVVFFIIPVLYFNLVPELKNLLVNSFSKLTTRK